MSSDQNNKRSNGESGSVKPDSGPIVHNNAQIDKQQDKEAEMEMTLNEHESKSESEKKVTELESKVNELETKVNESESKRSESERKVNELEMKVNELETKVNESESKRSESERKVNELESKVNKLETKVNESESKRSESEGKVNKLEMKVNELETNVNEINKKQIEETNKTNWIIKLILALVFVIVAIIIFRYMHPDIAHCPITGDATISEPLPPPLDTKPVMLKNFRDGMAKLRQQFPSQTDRFWLVLEAATEPIIIQSDPTHPAVVMLVAAGVANNSAANCLADQYAQLVTKTFQSQQRHTVFDSHVSDDVMKPDQVKRELDNQFTHAFETGAKTGIVRHVEKLPGEAAMIFYRFCDNDNAPFKDVSIVLTLTLESNDPGNERDSVAYKELRSVWKTSLDVDKVEPLLSRIGNSVAFARSESRQHLQSIGCSVNDF